MRIKSKTKGGIVRGGEKTSHKRGGVKFKVKSTGEKIEAEGNEPVVASSAFEDTSTHTYNGTNFEILNQINTKYGGQSLTEEVTSVDIGDVVICKISAGDKTPRTFTGTNKEVVSKINQSGGCKIIDDSERYFSKAECGCQLSEGGELKKEVFDDGGVIEGLLKKNNDGSLRDVIIKVLSDDEYYEKDSIIAIANGTIKADEIILQFTAQNPILTKFGEYAYFYPLYEHIVREGLEKAYIKYGAHLVSQKRKSDDKRIFDASKERAIHLIEPALREADARYTQRKSDGGESILYVKKNLEDANHTAVTLIAEMNEIGQLRAVTFMPNRKKISDDWVKSSPTFISTLPVQAASEGRHSEEHGENPIDTQRDESTERQSKSTNIIPNDQIGEKVELSNSILDSDSLSRWKKADEFTEYALNEIQYFLATKGVILTNDWTFGENYIQPYVKFDGDKLKEAVFIISDKNRKSIGEISFDSNGFTASSETFAWSAERFDDGGEISKRGQSITIETTSGKYEVYLFWDLPEAARTKAEFEVGRNIKSGDDSKPHVQDFWFNQDGSIWGIKRGADKIVPKMEVGGMVSNLTEEQWNLVRTDEFKAWFGDWEKLANIKKLESSEIIDLRKQLPLIAIPQDSVIQDHNKTRKYFNSAFNNFEIKNTDSGIVATVSNKAVKKILFHNAQKVYHLFLCYIDYIFSRSILITKEHNSDPINNKEIISYLYFMIGIMDLDGEERTVYTVVEDTRKHGYKIYDITVFPKKKSELIQWNGISNPRAQTNSDFKDKDKKLNLIFQINLHNKLDGNGEPLKEDVLSYLYKIAKNDVYDDVNQTINDLKTLLGLEVDLENMKKISQTIADLEVMLELQTNR